MSRRQQPLKLTKEQQKLAAANLNLARSQAWKCRGWGISYDELQAVAFLGLAKAAGRYDPNKINEVTGRPMKFSSLAVPTIRGELLHYARDKTWWFRHSHRHRELWLKIRDDVDVLTTEEITAKHGITKELLQELIGGLSGPPLPLLDELVPEVPVADGEDEIPAEEFEVAILLKAMRLLHHGPSVARAITHRKGIVYEKLCLVVHDDMPTLRAHLGLGQ